MKDWIKNIHTIDKTCVNSEGEYYKYTEFNRKPISLYIVVTRDCNARCPFCEYRGKLKKININKFEEIFIELSKYYDITTVHFTGGEPTLELDTINVLSKVIKEISPLTKTSVNTNGIFLNELSNIDTIDNIALSRHTIIDKDNFNIFRTNNIATYENIYNNSPLKYLNGMSSNHPYVALYNQRKIILCCGQGAWEDEMVKSTGLMKETFDRLGVHAWTDFWGYDVNHDWDWWRQQLPYFLGHIL